jgi:hypothetical protein
MWPFNPSYLDDFRWFSLSDRLSSSQNPRIAPDKMMASQAINPSSGLRVG